MGVTPRPPVNSKNGKTKQNNINRVLNRTNKIVEKLNELKTKYLELLLKELDKKNLNTSNKELLQQMYNGLATFIDTFYAILLNISKYIKPTNKPNKHIEEIATKEKELVTKQPNNKKYSLLYKPITKFNGLYKEILPKINSKYKIVLRLLSEIKEIIKDIMVWVTRLESGK